MDGIKARWQKIFTQLPSHSLMVLAAAPTKIRNADCEYPYRQDSYFYYVSGYTFDDAIIFLYKGVKDCKIILCCQENDATQARWVGERIGPDTACQQLGFDQAAPISEAKNIFLSLLDELKQIYYLPSHQPAFDKKLFSWLESYRVNTKKRSASPNQFIDARTILDEMRCFKDPHEIKLIQKACDISVAAHRHLMQTCHPNMNESALEGALIGQFMQQGSRAVAYNSIVAGGKNACILHYTQNNQILNNNELVLVDAGAEYDYYAADITRTFPVNGRFTPAQRAIYELVLQSQLAAIDKLKVGLPWGEIQATILKVLVQGLVSLGILQGDVGQLIDDKAYLPYYMHNSGHWLGLDVHDAGSYHVNDAVRTLENGMVFTIEPGLYFAPGSKAPEEYLGIGVRIEDDILMQDGKAVVLTSGVPKTIADIEALMGSA